MTARPPTSAAKRMICVAVGRNEGLRHVLGEMLPVKLLVRVTKAARVVHDNGATAGALEKKRRVEVSDIEGRVFAHEDCLHVREPNVALGPEGRMRGLVAARSPREPRAHASPPERNKSRGKQWRAT